MYKKLHKTGLSAANSIFFIVKHGLRINKRRETAIEARKKELGVRKKKNKCVIGIYLSMAASEIAPRCHGTTIKNELFPLL